MTEPRTSRPFQERFLDGFDRSQLREEVQKVKPRKLSGLRRKYAGWALGASLALGGIGIPLKVSNLLQSADAKAHGNPEVTAEKPLPLPPDTKDQIANDLATAKQIADQVSGGVTSAVQDVATTVASAPAQVAQAPQVIANLAEQVKQRFFQKEVPFGGIIYDEAKKNDLPPELLAAVVHK